jgi:hypothetical protein
MLNWDPSQDVLGIRYGLEVGLWVYVELGPIPGIKAWFESEAMGIC